MRFLSRIKALFTLRSALSNIDFEDAQRGSDWTDLDSYPSEANAMRVHTDRLDYSDTETPALYRKDAP